MIEFNKPLNQLELQVLSSIKDVQSNHIKFNNISFRVETIEDAEGRVFVLDKKRKYKEVFL